MRANFYVDGFNLYYGALKGSPHKWLNLVEFARHLLPTHTIQRVRYFSAAVSARVTDPGAPVRQRTYWRALQTLPEMTIHEGHFLDKKKWLPLVVPPAGGSPFVRVLTTEEKGSDVNLATMLLVDGFKGDFDVAAVISGDSDLTLPIKMIRDELKKSIIVFNPRQVHSRELHACASSYRTIRPNAYGSCQFATPLTDAHGTITKPATW
ncbi:MAG: NYN domain-containing protein [Myxococcota bacterium]|nr:NYN domain-containing protein [Myxococcota bacterium]